MPSACIVWIESITQTSGRSASIVAITASSEVSATAGNRERPFAEPLGAKPDLRRGLLAGDVEDAPAVRRQVAERHPGQGRLADPRRAAEEDERARDEAAAEDAVELIDAGPEPRPVGRRDVAQRDRLARRGSGALRGAALRRPTPLGSRRVSTSVFHSPQPAQRPDHASASWPQPWQT